MPALDRFHQVVRDALIRDGWTITHDPLTLQPVGRNLFIDLGAEKLIAAEKESRKIAVEIKTFAGNSLVAELQQAIGQYSMYEDVLTQLEPERTLYLAIPDAALEILEQDDLGRLALKRRLTHVIAFSPEMKEVTQWLPLPTP